MKRFWQSVGFNGNRLDDRELLEKQIVRRRLDPTAQTPRGIFGLDVAGSRQMYED
jgi:hypothetical protein